jgi:hypothetical protein
MQKFRINKLASSDHAKRAFKRATRWYIQEKDKPGGLSSRQIEAKVKREYDGVGPHAATIRRYVNTNIAGMSLLKIGVKGDLPPCVFKSLCVAFESFVHIQQINSCQGGITYKKLAARINTLLRHDYRQKMLQRILLATAKDLDASTLQIAEDLQVCWTTFANISIWFDNWEFYLVELGFATKDANGKVTISPEQLYFIISFDETCLLVDGSKGRKGGRPVITLHDPRLPYTGKITNTDSLTATLVMGSNAASEAPRERIELLSCANTHGKKFFAMGGSHVCSDYFFKRKHFWRGKRTSR